MTLSFMLALCCSVFYVINILIMVLYDSEKKILYGEKVPQIHHPYASLGEVLLYNLSKTPNKVTQINADDGIEITCQEMGLLMTCFAKNMIKLGFKFGDVVGLVGKNVTYSTPTIFGCYLLGCPTSPLDSLLTSAEIASTFSRTGPKIIFCDANAMELVKEALNLMEHRVKLVSLTHKVTGYSHISEYFVNPGNDYEIPRNSFKASETVATIQLTTGTTEEPKLAKVSHAQLLHKIQIFDHDENVFGFSFSIYSWITCTFLAVSAVLNHEKRLITVSPFNAETFFNLLDKFKFTHFVALPGHFRLLMESNRYETANFSSIKCLAVGGWHTPQELRKIIKNKLVNGRLKVGGGMTEIGGSLWCTDDDNVISSVTGKPVVNTEVKVLKDDGSFGGLNDIGELLVRRPDRFLGYFNKPEVTKRTIDHEGWLYTGDVGFIDNDLNVTLLGRKAFIIRQMNKVFQPSELEDLIEKIEGIVAVCVVSVPHAHKGELATAMVHRASESNVSEQMIHDAVKHLEDHKQLLGGVFFVDEIALTVSGKVKRNVMKEIAIALYAKKRFESK